MALPEVDGGEPHLEEGVDAAGSAVQDAVAPTATAAPWQRSRSAASPMRRDQSRAPAKPARCAALPSSRSRRRPRRPPERRRAAPSFSASPGTSSTARGSPPGHLATTRPAARRRVVPRCRRRGQSPARAPPSASPAAPLGFGASSSSEAAVGAAGRTRGQTPRGASRRPPRRAVDGKLGAITLTAAPATITLPGWKSPWRSAPRSCSSSAYPGT